MGNGWLVSLVANVLLFTLLAGIAASVDNSILRERFKKWWSIFLGLGCQFILLPLIGFCSVKVFRLPPVSGIALIAVTASPGGAYSNWWCSVFNADLALSIAMTTCSTVASLLLTPLNLAFYAHLAYGEVPEMDWLALMTSIAVMVAGILTGIFLSFRFPKRRRICNIIGNMAGLSLVLFSLATSSRDEPLWNKALEFYLAVGLPCLAGLLIAFAIGSAIPCISGPESVSVTVETSYQNTGLAMAIALATFGEKDRGKASSVPLFYGVTQVTCLPIFLFFAWRAGLTYAPKSEKFHHVLMRDYQPHAEEATPDPNTHVAEIVVLGDQGDSNLDVPDICTATSERQVDLKDNSEATPAVWGTLTEAGELPEEILRAVSGEVHLARAQAVAEDKTRQQL